MSNNFESSSLFSTDIFKDSSVQEEEQSSVAVQSKSVLTKAETDILDSLTPQEKKELQTVINQMDLTSPNFVSQYGKDARQGISSISERALSVTRTKDLGEAGESMSNLMLQLKGLDIPSQSRGIFKRAQSYVAQLNAKLAPAQKNVEKATKVMENYQQQLSHDNDVFNKLYTENLAYYRALTLYIIAGKKKLDTERSTTLVKLQQKAVSTGDMADAEKFNSYNSLLNQFDNLLSEFESSRVLCLQTAPAIRMAQENNKALIQKFEYIISTAVPAWQTQILLALNLENSKQASKAANSAIDFTNNLIRKNAETLRQGTTEIAQLSEREIISSETLEYANQQLIEGLEDVFRIHEEGRIKREESRQKRSAIEEELKNELLRLTSNSRK